jgi:vacuolar-type H+-ATPase subunit H
MRPIPARESVMELLDRLEGLIERSAAVPLTDKKMVDADAVLGLVEMIRSALPMELHDAHRLREEMETRHRGAQDEARTIVEAAQGTARKLVEQSEVLREIRRRAEDVLAQARSDAQATREGADAYARQALDELEDHVVRILEAIRKGHDLLQRGGE